MKLLWSKNLNNENFARYCGERFLFQENPDDDTDQTSTINNTATPDIFYYTQDTSNEIANVIGLNGTSYSVNNPDWWRNNTPDRTDGFMSESSRGFWNVPANLAKKITPRLAVQAEVLDGLPELDAANNEAANRFIDATNVLHQECLEATMNAIRTGHNLDTASFVDIKLAEQQIINANKTKQDLIKGPRGTKGNEKADKNRSLAQRVIENTNPANWFGRWNNRRKNQNTLERSETTTKNLLPKLDGVREQLKGEVNSIKGLIDTHKIGNLNRLNTLNNDEAQENMRGWHAFVQAVIADPQGFIDEGNNNGIFEEFNFGEICFHNERDINRVRLLDTLLTRGFAQESVMLNELNQNNTTTTDILGNLNQRTVIVQGTINDINHDGITRIRENLPPLSPPPTPVEGETPPSNDTIEVPILVKDIISEITRINLVQNPGEPFDIYNTILVDAPLHISEVEKLPYLLRYLQDEDNIAILTEFDQSKADKLHNWFNIFNIAQVEDPYDGLNNATAREAGISLLNLGQNALEAVAGDDLRNSLQPDHQGEFLNNLGPIEAFLEGFGSRQRIIERITENNRGILGEILTRLTEIKETLSGFADNAVNALIAENTRVGQAHTPATDDREAIFPDRRTLAIRIPGGWNDDLNGEFNNFRNNIGNVDGEGDGFQIPPVPAAAGIAGRIGTYLSSEAQKFRESVFQEYVSTSTQKDWAFLQNAEIGRDFPLVQGALMDDSTSSTYSVGNARAFDNLTVVENKNGEALVLRSLEEGIGEVGDENYIPPGSRFQIKLINNSDNKPRLRLSMVVPDNNENLADFDNGRIFELYSVTTGLAA